MGRQPWVVQGLLLTRNAVSPSVPAWEVLISLVGFTLLYGVLAVVDGWLMFKYAKTVPPQTPADEHSETGDLAMAY
jgi:cytochrome d ubiquinol oxidase subunit I